MGKAKIAETLARAGLHPGVTTVGRVLREQPQPKPPRSDSPAAGKQRVVTAKYSGHLWHVDLTTIPVTGFWCPWFHFALPQCWPFAWWLGFVVDHFSCRVMGIQPPRYGAVGKHGSLAVIERLILSAKILLRHLPLVPLRADAFRREVGFVIDWYNGQRPHSTLGGRTPDERYFGRFPANRKPRFEPRRWPRGSPCARPWALVRGKPGVQLELDVEFSAGRSHLPIVRIRRAA